MVPEMDPRAVSGTKDRDDSVESLGDLPNEPAWRCVKCGVWRLAESDKPCADCGSKEWRKGLRIRLRKPFAEILESCFGKVPNA